MSFCSFKCRKPLPVRSSPLAFHSSNPIQASLSPICMHILFCFPRSWHFLCCTIDPDAVDVH